MLLGAFLIFQTFNKTYIVKNRLGITANKFSLAPKLPAYLILSCI